MIRISKLKGKAAGIASATSAAAFSVFAQTSPGPTSPASDDSFLGFYGALLGVFAAAAIGAAIVLFLLRRRSSAKADEVTQLLSGDDSTDPKPDEMQMTHEQTENAEPAQVPVAAILQPHPFDPNARFIESPLNSFMRLECTAPFPELPESDDESLLNAIEQTQEESDEDVEVRTLALEVLAGFRTCNSISAISQIALYDLSSKLRSSAVSILADIDHESVFETIVTACADPTLEVRAAAARSMVRLRLDRAHAWTRIIESDDNARMRHAARAAIEGDLVERSFERLIHQDQNIAYEAYALTALLIKANETEPIYRTLAEHKDENVKLALLHVLQTIRNETTFESLSELLIHYELTPAVAVKVDEVRSCMQLMTV